MFFLLPRRFRRCSFRFPMMCPCGKNLESLSFSLFLWGSRSGFKVRKVTVASTTILTFLDLLNVEDRVAYLDSFATGACWQKAHHLSTTCPDHVLTSMFFTCERCEGCEITCENPDSKADQGRSTLIIHPPNLGRTRNI